MVGQSNERGGWDLIQIRVPLELIGGCAGVDPHRINWHHTTTACKIVAVAVRHHTLLALVGSTLLLDITSNLDIKPNSKRGRQYRHYYS